MAPVKVRDKVTGEIGVWNGSTFTPDTPKVEKKEGGIGNWLEKIMTGEQEFVARQREAIKQPEQSFKKAVEEAPKNIETLVRLAGGEDIVEAKKKADVGKGFTGLFEEKIIENLPESVKSSFPARAGIDLGVELAGKATEFVTDPKALTTALFIGKGAEALFSSLSPATQHALTRSRPMKQLLGKGWRKLSSTEKLVKANRLGRDVKLAMKNQPGDRATLRSMHNSDFFRDRMTSNEVAAYQAGLEKGWPGYKTPNGNYLVKIEEGLRTISQKAGVIPFPQETAMAGGMMHKVPPVLQKWMSKGVKVTGRDAPIRITDPEAKIKSVSGDMVDLPTGHEMTPFRLSNGKIWLHDGEEVLVDSGQLQNLKNKNLVLGPSGKLAMPEGVEVESFGEARIGEGRVDDLPNGKFRATYPGLQDQVFDTRVAALQYLSETRRRVGTPTTKYENWQLEGRKTDYFEDLIKVSKEDEIAGFGLGGEVYAGPHYGPGTAAWVRGNMRVDNTGKKVLFVEELQDLASEGVEGTQELEKLVGSRNKSFDLRVKRILQKAIDVGADKISWTTGEQQAERYDLSKQLTSVYYSKAGNKYRILMELKDGTLEEVSVPESRLASEVGKDLAQKIVSGEGEKIPTAVAGEKGRTRLEGNDLKIGAGWAKQLYDLQLPKALKKLTGGKIEQIQIQTVGTDDPKQIQGWHRQQSLTLTPAIKAKLVGDQPMAGGLPTPLQPGEPSSIIENVPQLGRGDQVTWYSKTKQGLTSGTIVHIAPNGNYLVKTEEGLRTIKPERAINSTEQEDVERMERAKTQVRRIGAAKGGVGEGKIAIIASGKNGYIVIKTASNHGEAIDATREGGQYWDAINAIRAGGEIKFTRARVDELGQLRAMPDEPIVQDEIDNIISGRPPVEPIAANETPIPPGPPVVPGKTPDTFPEPEPGGEIVKELPKVNWLKQSINNINKHFSIEGSFKLVDADESGRAVKSIPGEVVAHLIPYSKLVLKVTRMGNKTGLTKTDFEDMLYILAQPNLIKELSTKAQEAYKPILKEYRNYFDEYEKLHKQVGTFKVGWPEVQKIELKELIEESLAGLKRERITPNETEALWDVINDARGALKFLNDNAIKYVPINWFSKLFQQDIRKTAFTLNRFYGDRKTVDIRALGEYFLKQPLIVDEKTGKVLEYVIDRADLDIRTVGAHYAQDSGKKIALGKALQAFRKDGLIVPVAKQPNWPKFPKHVFKELKGERVHPYVFDWAMAYHKGLGASTTLRKAIAYGKLLSFTKFWFLATYDAFEGVVSGALLSPRLPLTIYRSAKSLLFRDKHLVDMYRYNAFSQPVTMPRELFVKDMQKLEKWGNFPSIALDYIKENMWVGETLGKKLKHLPMGLLDLAYLPLWFTSWFGDRFMRGIGYHHLISKGWSPAEAGNMTGEVFGGYEDVPARTRRNVAAVIYTPTFFITMFKAQKRMIMAPIKILSDPKKHFTKEGRKDPGGKRERFRAAMLMRLLMGYVFMDVVWRTMGFRRDRYGTKYVKTVADDRGMSKELVVSLPHPYNVIWRNYHGLTNLPKYGDQWKSWTNSAKWRLTPMWRNSVMMLTNQKADYSPITNKLFRDPQQQWEDMTIFGVRETIKIVDDIARIGEDGTRQEAQRAFQKDLGPYWSKVLGVFSTAYLRGLPEGRMAYKLRALEQATRKYMTTDAMQDPELSEQFFRNFGERLKEINEEYEESKGGRR